MSYGKRGVRLPGCTKGNLSYFERYRMQRRRNPDPLNRRMDALREAQMQKIEQRKQTAGETTV